MGIRLDWEIEAEREKYQHNAGEDPETRRKRRRARARFLLVLFIMLGLIGAAVGVVVLRLRQVEAEAAQVVSDTVEAEVTALRIGDRTAFLAMQRSATEDWMQLQDANFAHYQALKQSDSVTLSGRVIDVKLDGPRARAQVEEIVDGVPYGRVWFYWRYEDGWHHVPPDYTFWGEAQTASAENVVVRYNEVDAVVAQAVAARVANWRRASCTALACAETPRLTVEIVPSATLQIGWSASDAWTLQMPSPYVTTARLDMPFDTDTQLKAAELLAERLVGDFSPVYPADAYYLRQGIVSWLVKRFAEVETNSFLVSSLADRYGDPAVGRLLQALQPDSSASVIGSVTGTSLDAAGLDWRDFLTWRLVTENDLIARQDQAGFLALYVPAMQEQALARFTAGASADTLTVVSAISEQDAAGMSQLRAVAQAGEDTTRQEVIFKLIDGTWKRAS